MRKSAIGFAFLLLALAGTAAADNKPVVFTRSGMQEAALPWRFIDTPLSGGDARRLHWHFGYAEMRTPIGPVRLVYLPLAMPLNGAPGSRNWNRTPNAFDLMNVTIPPRPEPEGSTLSSDQKALLQVRPDSGGD